MAHISRPVPLAFEYSETPLAERVADLLATNRAPVYLVHFTQRAAAEAAQSLMSLAICSKEEKAVLATLEVGQRTLLSLLERWDPRPDRRPPDSAETPRP